jgi:hypothetical protein
MHTMSSKRLAPDTASGVHVEPSQRAAIAVCPVAVSADPRAVYPTAMQNELDPHDTDASV